MGEVDGLSSVQASHRQGPGRRKWLVLICQACKAAPESQPGEVKIWWLLRMEELPDTPPAVRDLLG